MSSLNWQELKQLEITRQINETLFAITDHDGNWSSQEKTSSKSVAEINNGKNHPLMTDEIQDADVYNFIQFRKASFYGPEKITCQFCFSDYKSAKIIKCSAKTHNFCKSCLKNFWQVGLKDFSTWSLDENVADQNGYSLPICPYSMVEEQGPNHVLLSLGQLQNVATFKNCRKDFVKFCELQANKLIYQVFKNKIITCADKKCLQPIILNCQLDNPIHGDKKENNRFPVCCPACNFTFCSSCRQKSHSPFDCKNATFNSIISHSIKDGLVKLTQDLTFTDHHLIDTSDSSDNQKFIKILSNYTDQVFKAIEKMKIHVDFSISGNECNLASRAFVAEQLRSKTGYILSDLKGKYLLFLRSTFSLGQLSLIEKQETLNLEEIEKLYQSHIDEKSIATIRELCVSCPVCLVPIEKHLGCNNMRCANCSKSFNYKWGGSAVKELDLEQYQKLDVKSNNRKSLHYVPENRLPTNKFIVGKTKENYVKKSTGKKLLPSEKRKKKQAENGILDKTIDSEMARTKYYGKKYFC